MVFVNPQMTDESLAKTYEDRGDPEGLIAFYARVTTPTKLAEFDRILEQIELMLPGKGRILDFGCGPAYFVERAAGRGWESHGVELGPWAQQAAERRGVRNFHLGTLAGQGFPDGWFDVVCAEQVIEHLPNPRADLAEICRVLRPDGILYANVPNYRCLSILLGCDDFELNLPMAHLNYFTPRTFRRLIEPCGFRVLRTSSFGGLKLENLVGRRTSSPEARAHRGEPQVASSNSPAPKPPLAKRWVHPVVRKVLYQWAKVGMSLEIFARKQ